MSAIADGVEGGEDGPAPVIQVLFALHPNFGAQELVGPVEILSKALHKIGDPSPLTSFPIPFHPIPSSRTRSSSTNTHDLPMQKAKPSTALSPPPPKA